MNVGPRGLRFSGRPSLPVLLQTEAAECGLACLAMVATFHGREIDLVSLRGHYKVSLRGMTLRSLIVAGNELGFCCRPLRVELAELRELRLPAILHWDMSHFVVLKRVSRRHLVVHDPALGRRTYTLREASCRVSGVALELLPTPEFERGVETSKLRLTDLWERSSGLTRSLVQLLAVSLLLQVFALASPFYMQLVVDEGLSRQDGSLLELLAVAFLLLMLIQLGTQALRAYLVLHLGSQLSFQIAANVFRQLLRLPLAYFEKRDLGDVLSRFGAMEPIRRLFTTGLVTVAIDGLTALATLVMIFLYSPTLSWLVLGATALYAALRAALYPLLRERSEEQITATARGDSTLMETLRAVQSIKVFGCEAEREATWQNRHARLANAGIRIGKLGIGFEAISGFLFGLENVIVVYLGARMVLAAEMSVGMLFAFMSYKGQFTGRLSALIDQSVEWRMLDVHLGRLADIVLAPREAGLAGSEFSGEPLAGRLELAGVGFRYSSSDPPVFEDLNLAVEPGESIAITGRSGSGKTTLIKLMLGLLEPTSGEVRVDGRRLEQLGLRAYRRQTAAVLQEDQLLSGSIADNICMFDSERDVARLWHSAGLAAIHEEIMAMPMQYESLIGDLGTMLSSGQRQRVLLARALYRRPRVLFLDEGLSHLDEQLAARISSAISTLDMTRVMVTHRRGLIQGADRELAL